MRKWLICLAMVTCLLTGTQAFAQAQGNGQPTALSDEDRLMLRVVYAYVKSACTQNPSETYCASLLPEQSVAVAQTTAASPTPPAPTGDVPVSPETRDHLAPADATRHLTKDTGLSVPGKNSADVSFAVTSDTKTASASLSVDLSPVTKSLSTLSLTVQTPFGQGSDYQNLATLDGLTKATTAALQFTFIPKARYVSRSLAYNSDEYQFSCREIFAEATKIDSKIAEDPLMKATGEWCNAGNLLQVITKSNITPSIKEILAHRIDKIRGYTAPILKNMWMITLNGKFGYEQHSYYSDANLAKSTVDRYPWQFGAAATYVFDRGRMSFTLGYDFQKTYEDGRLDGQQEVLCPAATTGNVKCVNGYINAPERQDKHLFSADWRFIAPKGSFFIPIGIDPGATYDVKSHEYGFQFPIYLATNSSKGLTGGVRYDYTSAKKVSTFGVFVSAAFCVLPSFSGCSALDSKASN